MKYTLSARPATWNGLQELPKEIHTLQSTPELSEFELLAAVCRLHGFVCAFDLLTGAEHGTEKDTDLDVVSTAFQAYLLPKMPLSMYSQQDARIQTRITNHPPHAIDSTNDTKIDLNSLSH